MSSSLNRIFKVVWSKVQMAWVAVSEAVSGQGKVQSVLRRERRVLEATTAAAASSEEATYKVVWDGERMTLVSLSQYQYRIARRIPLLNAPRKVVATAMLGGSAFSGGVFAAPPAVNQLPTGGAVAAGQASIAQSGNTMTVTQSSNRAAINWNTFDIGSQAQVNFVQPSSNAVALNRVNSPNPSQIYGQLNANGQVYLINAAGVYFAPGAQVNVGGIVATTHSMSDAAFMAGSNTFNRNGATGAVINDGNIQASLGGYIAMLAPEVRNGGVLVAQAGTVAMAGGESITLNFGANSKLESLTVTASQLATLVENRHAISTPNGQVILSAAATNQLAASVINSGTIEAKGISQQGGRIILDGGSTGTVTQSGALNASSDTAKGGNVTLTADNITLASGSSINANGATGGGTVLVGGDWQGSGTLQQATTVLMQQGATIDASATDNGDGGKVVLWSNVNNANSVTEAHGTILAKGGVQSGNGGQVETSGHTLDTEGAFVNAGAPRGTGGLWLLDPADSTVTQTIADGYQATLNTGTSVTNAVTGTININDGVTISKTLGGDATLTFSATDRIAARTGSTPGNYTITSSSGKLNVVLRAESDGGTDYGVDVGSITTNGGNLWVGGGTDATWNGLAVGNGAAYGGTSGANANAVGMKGNINTAGGDVLIAGYTKTDLTNYGDIAAIGATRTIDVGTGNISLLTYHSDYDSTVGNYKINLNTTGKLTLAPISGQDWYWTNFNWNGTTSGNDFVGSVGASGLVIKNIASLGGLTIGTYQGTGVAGDTVYVSSNTKNTIVDTAININGPIYLYGGNITLNAGLTSTGANDAMLFKALGKISTGANNLTFQTNNGSLVFWSNANSTSGGGINLNNTGLTFNTANGTTSQTTGGGNLLFGGGAAVDANGNPTGAAVSSGSAISFNAQSAGNNITKMYTGGGNITLNGTGTNAILFAQASLINAGTGYLSITGNSTASGLQFNGYGGATNGTVVTAQGITLNGTAANANEFGVYTGNNLINLTSTGSGVLTITGASTGVGGQGIYIGGGFNLTSASGNITLTGTATSSTAIAFAVGGGGNISSTAGGSITVNGTSSAWTGLASFAVVNYSATSGNISILANGAGSSYAGMYLYGGNITTTTGDVLIQGQSVGHVGVYLTNAATNVSTAGGSITVNGTSNTHYGIYSDQAVSLNTSAGSGGITVNATSNTTVGAYFNANLNLISGAGNINLTGTSGPGAAAGAGQGVYIKQGNVSTTTGNITLTGTSDSSTGLEFGSLTDIANVTSSSGNITLTGTTTSGVYGIYFYGSNISTGANISLLSSNQLQLDASVYSTGAGSLLLRANSFSHSLGTAPKLGTNGSISILPTLDSAGFSAGFNTSEYNINPTINTVAYTANSLVIGNTYNTQAVNWNTVGTVAGPITVYGGTVSLSANMISSGTGDIWIQANSDVISAVNFLSGGNILKTGGDRSTITLRSAGSVYTNYGNITATNTNGTNVILWSDYGNTNNGGVAFGNISTNGGSIWIGGSNSVNGSTTWNGLTVGNGPAVGSSAQNWYPMQMSGNIASSGGDVLLWAGNTSHGASEYGIGIPSYRSISAGSGNVTLLTNQIYNINNGNGILYLNTTGNLTFAPADGAWTNGFGLTGVYNTPTTLTLNNIGGTGQFVDIQNIASLTGLTIGQYTGMSGLTQGNTGNVTVGSVASIAGPITVYGGNVTVNATLTSTATAEHLIKATSGNVVLNAGFNQTNGAGSSLTVQATGNITQAAGANITANGSSNLNVLMWSNSANTTPNATISVGNITTNNGSLWVGGGLDSETSSWSGLYVGRGGSLITLNGNLSVGEGAVLLNEKSGNSLQVGSANLSISATNFNSSLLSSIELVSDSFSGLPLTLNTNGSISFLSNSGNFGANFYWNGSVSGDVFTGSGSLNNIKINNWGQSIASGQTANVSRITIGNGQNIASFLNDNTGNVTVNADILVPVAICVTGSSITLNGNVGTSTTSTFGTALNFSGNVTQGAGSTLYSKFSFGNSSFGLATPNVSITNAGNQISDIFSSGVNNLAVVSNYTAAALVIERIATSTGTVSVKNSGDISLPSVGGYIQTSSRANSTSTPAVLIAAGYNQAVGSTGGNISIGATTYNFQTGAGGLTMLYTGAVSNANLTSTVSSSANGDAYGNFRYGTNLTTVGYNTTAATLVGNASTSRNVYALYREAPALTISVPSSNVTYGSTGSTSLSSTAVNGNTFTQIFGAGNEPVANVSGTVSTAGYYTAGNHTVNITGSSTNLLGYATPTYTNGTMTITKANLTVAGTVAANKEYDGTTAATFTNNGSPVGVLSNATSSVTDVVTLTTSGVFSDKNAANGVALTMADSISGTDAANYNIVQPTVTANITPRTVTLNNTQTYSGSNLLTNVSIGNLVAGESLTYTGATANSSQVANNSINYISAISLGNEVGATVVSGGLAANYQLPTLNHTNAPVTINAALLGITANATYNGANAFTNQANGTNYQLVGLVNGETITTANLTINNANVISANNYVTGLTVASGNASMSNYVLNGSYNATPNTNTTNTFTLTAANLTITANSSSKVYGDTLTFAGTEFTYTGNVSGQTVTGAALSSSGAANTSSVAGSPYTIAISGATGAGGFNVSNYNISYVNGSLAVTPAPLGIEAAGTYSASNTVAPTSYTLTGLKNGETITAIASLSVNDANVAATTNGTQYITDIGATNGTANLANYQINGSRNGTANTTTTNFFTMTRANLTVTPDNDAIFIGEALPPTANYTVSYSGFVGGQTAAGLLGSGALTAGNVTNSAGNAGNITVSARNYNLTGIGWSADNYTINTANGTFTVSPADALLIQVGSKSMTYGTNITSTNSLYGTPTVRYMANGSAAVTLTYNAGLSSGNHYVYNDNANGSVSFNLTVNNGSYSTSNNLKAGRGYQLATSNINVTGSNLVFANASDPATTTGALAVNAMNVTASASNVTKAYDGTTSMNGLAIALTPAAITNDKVTASGAGAFSQANVGTNLSYNVTGLALTGDDASNYVLNGGTSFSGTDGAITKAFLGISANATYNGGTSFTNLVSGTNYTLTGLVNGETISSATLAVHNGTVAGNTGNYVTGLAVVSGSALMSNYQLNSVANSTLATNVTNTFTVDRAQLGISANGTYNGTNSFANQANGTNYVLTGLVNSETISTATLTLNNANVTPSNYVTGISVLSGTADISNYVLNSGYSGVTGTTNNAFNMAQAALTITANSTSKTYGQTVNLTANGFNPIGLVNGETVTNVTLSSLGAAADAPVAGSPFAIQISNASGAGATSQFASGNYNITYVDGLLTVNRANLTITANNTSTQYGLGTTLGTTAFATDGLQNGETVGNVTLSSVGIANISHVGNYNITASNAVNGNFTASNYNISYVNGTLAVYAANINVTADNQSRLYGGANPTSGNTTLTSGTLYNGDTLSTANVSSTANATSNVGNYTLTASNQTMSGVAQATDYNITYVAGTLAVNPAPLTITANSSSKTYGQTVVFNGTEFSSSNLVNSETLSTASLASTGAAANAAVNGGNSYTVTIANATGANGFVASNYNISYVNGALTINAAPLGISATGTYSGTTLLTPTTFTLTGLVAGDTVNSIGSVMVNNANVNLGNRITGINVSNGSANMANYQLNASQNTTPNTTTTNSFAMAQANASITADNAAIFVTQSLPGSYNVTYNGLVNGESASTITGLSAGTVSNTATGSSSAGSFTLTPGGYSATNYNFSYVNGTFTVVSANTLLVQTGAVNSNYGTNATIAPTSVQYMANNLSLATLSQTTALGNNSYLYTDPNGGTVTLSLAAANAATSGSGNLKAQGYQVTGAVLNQTSTNFNGSAVYTGSLTVAPVTVTPSTSNVSKVYDGTTAMNGLNIALTPAAFTGDQVSTSGSGAFAQANAGTNLSYTVSGMMLGGADASNYVLLGGANTFSGTNGVITPRTVTLNATQVYSGSTTLTNVSIGNLVGSETLTYTGNASSKNVQDNGTNYIANLVLGNGTNGGLSSNYQYPTLNVTNAPVTITRLTSVTWIGGANGNWFDPANWAGGAVPDLNNVANVVIPNGVTVSFNTSGIVPPVQPGTVSIDGLGGAGGNLTQTSGTLDVGSGGIALGTLALQGGNLSSQGAVALTTFNQSGGVSTFGSTLTTDNYIQSNGTTSVTGNLTATNVTLTGGNTTTLGSLNVNGSYNQTGGQVNVTGAANITTTGTMTLGNLTVGGALNANSTAGSINQSAGSRMAVTGRASFYAPAGTISLNPNNSFLGGNSIIDHNGDRNKPAVTSDWVFQQIMVQGGTMVYVPLPKAQVRESRKTHTALNFTGDVVLLADETPEKATDPGFMAQPEAGFTDRFFDTEPRITLLPETAGSKLVQHGERLFIVNTDSARGRLDQEPVVLPKPGLQSSTPEDPVSGTPEKISLLAQ